MGRFDDIAEAAAEKTNQALADNLAEHTTLSSDELASMLPSKADKQNFAQLMSIVHAQTSQNEKIAALRSNIDSLGEVLLKVVRKVT